MPWISEHCRWPVAALLLAASLVARAEEPATTTDIVLRAERATLSQQEGLGIYEGNAELIQGLRSLKADRIEIRLVDGKPSRVEATGEPVRLLDQDLEARAGRLVYDIEGRRILLYRQARIVHQGRTFEGGELVYELDNRRISARGDEQEGDGRIRLVIPAEEGGLTP